MPLRNSTFILASVTTLIVVAVILSIIHYEDAKARWVPVSALGVRLPRPAHIPEVMYRVATSETGTTTVQVTTAALDVAYPGCTVGVFSRIDKPVTATTTDRWTEDNLHAAEQDLEGMPAQVKEFPGFYLLFEPSHAACSVSADDQSQEAAVRDAVWKSVSEAELI